MCILLLLKEFASLQLIQAKGKVCTQKEEPKSQCNPFLKIPIVFAVAAGRVESVSILCEEMQEKAAPLVSPMLFLRFPFLT
jgi:hypothetical protein